MEQTSVSPVFVGRGTEVGALEAALRRADAGQPQAVLIGGEAGVGKTRLIEEFLGTACRGGAVTTMGGCLEVGAEGLPFAPLATALRRLHRGLGAELERAAEGMEGHLTRLLPEFGADDAEPNDEFGRARLFEHTARLFERLSDGQTIVLAVEDLHWSDRSTRELLAYLIRTLHRARVLIVATYRTDDLHRRHPLRPFLAELDRLRTVQRLELARFGRAEVAAQLAGILGTEAPGRSLVDRIHERSEGNPFFVEELATAHQEGCHTGLTESLRDLLLVRVEALPDETQRVLRIAAEGGSYVEHGLLEAVLDEGEESLTEALRTAVGANVLRPDTDGEGYRFRHALVREAVSDDLLPGERYRINRRYATVLEQQGELVCGNGLDARLANYWYHAHEPAKALPTALEAARAARRRNAFAEQLRMLERALELWDEVPEEIRDTSVRPHDWAGTFPACGCDGAHCAGLYLVDVLAEAVTAARRSGDRDRGLSLAKRALKLVDEEAEPERAAWFMIQRAQMFGHLRRGGAQEEIDRAQQLVAGLRPSPVQAEVLALAVGHVMLLDPSAGDMAMAERAVELAREVDAPMVELHALTTLGTLRANLGDPEAGLALLHEAVERARPAGVVDVLCRALNNLSSMELSLGRAEEAAALAREGLAVAQGNGLLANTGAILAGNLVEALLVLGRRQEAEELLAEWDDSRAGTFHAFLDRLRSELALDRGDLAAAEEHFQRARQAGKVVQQPQHDLPVARLAIRLAMRAGRPLDARAELLAVLDGLADRPAGDGLSDGCVNGLLPVLVEGAAAEADSRGVPSADLGRPVVLRRIAEVAAGLRPGTELHRAWSELLAAELARAEGVDSPGQWAAAVGSLRALGLGCPLGQALYRQAEALLAEGRREEAAGLLREVDELVTSGRYLRQDAALLTARAGLAAARPAPAPRAAEPADPAEEFGLTPRERDVLDRLALGRTNRQIAEELYISPKTASVHVSNILAKLSVGSRGEAAALAHRLQLLGQGA
ncbi:helix-turn-helix transcriptional regulator [Kitasatospora albolonga]|uniref:helix-turn-helix transcriptional regulator n=1 Tax=Kitasatospora albolonga TaxID=68173 RepID=UPI0031EED223